MLQNNELRAISIAVNNKWEEQSLKQEQGYHQRIGRVLPANMTLLVFAILLHLLGGDIFDVVIFLIFLYFCIHTFD